MSTIRQNSRKATISAVSPRKRVFLSARWEALSMINFRIEPELLLPLVPQGTTLDLFGGVAYVSVVGFSFRNTRLLGLSVPWHIDFEEVNLRFYVQRTVGHEVRHGVCFVKEIVPQWAIANVARWSYNEPYVALPMRSEVNLGRIAAANSAGKTHTVSYGWKTSSGWVGMQISTRGERQAAAEGSLEEFIAEHYWGYCRQRDGGTIEYEVEHPRWNVWQAEAAPWQGDVPAFYGEPWSSALQKQPSSAFLADGSAVKVFRPTHIA